MGLFNSIYTAGPNGLWIFLLVSVLMGASTAYVAGRAIAETWRPFWQGIAYALVIGLAVRFIHFALFQEALLSGRNYLTDCAVLIAAVAIGYTATRRRQMLQQYGVLSAQTEVGETKAQE